MHTDITKRKKSEEEVISLSRFPSENPNPVLRINIKGVIIYANLASEKIFEDIKGKPGMVIPEFIRSPLYESIISDKKMEIERNIKGRDYMFSIVPVANMDYANVYGLDITNYKK
jgi:two-component system, chemotaxis family, CheB/CheR fusion protein